MRWLRTLIAVAVAGVAVTGCSPDVKTSVPPPSSDDKPLGTPKAFGGAKQRPAK